MSENTAQNNNQSTETVAEEQGRPKYPDKFMFREFITAASPDKLFHDQFGYVGAKYVKDDMYFDLSISDGRKTTQFYYGFSTEEEILDAIRLAETLVTIGDALGTKAAEHLNALRESK